ncbi:MAG: bifunctional nuclease family protein [Flavobacteriales bacterium]|nr:bifunctional nuclease family protein [Flavobacteriales bacterium]
MEKIGLEIIGLSYSQTQTGAYALILKELDGKRRLPIIIGGFEAQAIAIEIEKMTPSRPLTHDLFKSFSDSFDIEIKEIIIYNLMEGVFFSQLICVDANGVEREIDARTSDAVALAVRFQCPIYTYEFILSSAGIILDDELASESEMDETFELDVVQENLQSDTQKSMDQLERELEEALTAEDYERASKIRDEINSRSKNN